MNKNEHEKVIFHYNNIWKAVARIPCPKVSPFRRTTKTKTKNRNYRPIYLADISRRGDYHPLCNCFTGFRK